MKKELLEASREVIGQHLKERRESKKISLYQIEKTHGVRFETLKSIESGSKNYTINNFLAYISAIDCYFYIADKDGKKLNHDYLIAQGEKFDPEK